MKKLPFKPTALRRPSLPRHASSDDDAKDGGGDDGLALFRRSKEMEPIMAADLERRAKKKQRRGEERKRLLAKHARHDEDDVDARSTPHARDQSMPAIDLSGPPRGDSAPVTPPASKRSRTSRTLSLGPDQGRDATLDSPSTRLPSSSQPITPIRESPSVQPAQPRWHQATPKDNSHEATAAPPSAQAIPIDSDDSDDSDESDDIRVLPSPSTNRGNDAAISSSPFSPPPPPADDDDDADADDEFSEYVRRAEAQRARDKALQESAANKGQGRDTVDILITSTVPGAGPCLFKYAFDKQLRLLRNSWVALQRQKGAQLLPEQQDDIILTWRRKKVFVFSTLSNLGIRPTQGDGQLRVDGNARHGLIDGGTRLHMEAWTPDLFQAMEERQALRWKREAGDLSASEDDGDNGGGGGGGSGGHGADDAPPPTPEVKIRVILKARGLDDVKLTVRPETTVETLVVGFRTQRAIASDKAVGVVFEGERLEEHVTMEDADIVDMDLIDVYVN